METTYILIKKINPFTAELTDKLYDPELKSSLSIIKVDLTLVPEDNYQIELIDSSKNKVALIINHLCITEIKYDSKKKNIIFKIDEIPKEIGRKMEFASTNFDIRIDIIRALKNIESKTAK